MKAIKTRTNYTIEGEDETGLIPKETTLMTVFYSSEGNIRGISFMGPGYSSDPEAIRKFYSARQETREGIERVVALLGPL